MTYVGICLTLRAQLANSFLYFLPHADGQFGMAVVLIVANRTMYLYGELFVKVRHSISIVDFWEMTENYIKKNKH